MQITLQSILNNITSVHSEKLLREQLADGRFPSTWNSYMACRFRSFSSMSQVVLPVAEEICKIEDPRVACMVLYNLCDGKEGGRPTAYKPSPFTE